MINASVRAGYQLTGVILQQDDGVLVSNRLEQPLPIVDEVLYIDRIPLGMLAAIEVAVPGKVIETLSNPYGIATVFGLNAEETKNIVPMARALIGNRSAVVVKTPSGDGQSTRHSRRESGTAFSGTHAPCRCCRRC
ncbi:propanediol utilization diol dehydratase reactivation protein [Citrobacter koseri]|uniref:Propanediol utilization diol dehydratase reactivation protein n=1 Tax=Citrobacter koseri TaxID=545 RepID=A0A2X2VUC3_CITKO|nr:propanediol utilization diol dehydratase reactivation protein [Citrobacter koseri]